MDFYATLVEIVSMHQGLWMLSFFKKVLQTIQQLFQTVRFDTLYNNRLSKHSEPIRAFLKINLTQSICVKFLLKL